MKNIHEKFILFLEEYTAKKLKFIAVESFYVPSNNLINIFNPCLKSIILVWGKSVQEISEIQKDT